MIEAILKKEEAIEEGRVKKNLKKKKEFCLEPHRGPGASMGRKNSRAPHFGALGAPMGATWAPFCRKN